MDRIVTSLTHIYARHTMKLIRIGITIHIRLNNDVLNTRVSGFVWSYIMDGVRSHDKCEYYCIPKLNHNYYL
jgi:hypothetical protein